MKHEDLVALMVILMTAGTGDNAGHQHGLLDHRSREALDKLIVKLENLK